MIRVPVVVLVKPFGLWESGCKDANVELVVGDVNRNSHAVD